MAEGVLFSIAEELIKKLGSLAAQEVAFWCGVKDQLCKLKGTVTRIKAVLDDAAEQARKQNNQLKDWLGKLQDAVYDAEDLLGDFSTEVQRKQLVYGNKVWREVRVFFSSSNQFVYGLRMGHKVKALRERLADMEADSKQFNFEVRAEEKASLTNVREQTTSSEPEVIVGREGDKVTVKNFLLNSNYEQNVSVISIVGIGGLGKTTLAQHVFNDEQVNVHFSLKLWVSVSGGLDVKKILKDILEAIPKKDSNLEAAGIRGDSDPLENLKNELEKKIEKKKYLLVLDDVWDGKDVQDDGEKWDSLKKLLPHDGVGSRIIVTTRSLVIAKFTSKIPPHVLQGLSEDASWDLFEEKAIPQSQKSNHVGNEVIRREIVKRCCGVPLVIKAIARLMFLKDRAQWLSFIVNEFPDSIRDDNIIETLKLSYNPLPSYMKHCFAYCSLFPKGHKIDVKSLIQLWIAQGFISSSGGGSLEINGLRCFENLVWRSFFHEVKKDDLGNIESCKMHDFMHDLATKVAGFESTKVDTRGGNRISDLTRHVSFDMELDLSQQIPTPSPSAKRLRTLMMLGGKWKEDAWQSICGDFRRLRVLDLHNLRIREVSPLIEKLKLLKYLDLSNNDMEALPKSITNLINLQVLKLNGCRKLKALPRDIRKLIKLRHLDVGCSLDHDLCEKLEYMPCGIGKLTCLQTLSYFVVAKKSGESKMVGGLDELGRLNELRGRLEIRVKGYRSNSFISEFEGAKLIEKQYLQSLTLKWAIVEDDDIDLSDKMLQSLHPHVNLQELHVVNYGGKRFPSWLSHLTNLVKINLETCGRCEQIPSLHGIPSLKALNIDSFPRLEYIDSEGVGGRSVSMFFPCLKKLEVRACHRLKGWWNKNDESTTTTEEELMTLYFPCLSSLTILSCPKLSSMPFFPTLDDELYLSQTSSVPLQQTMKMIGWKSTSSEASPSPPSSFVHPLSKLKELYIIHVADMEYLLEDVLQNLSSLRLLSIQNCPRLQALHLPNQGMHLLQRLSIRNCGELRSILESQSQGIPNLPSLQHLLINDCNEELNVRLSEGKEGVKYWPYLNHIPTIIIGGYYIQKDGRYVKEEKLRYI